MAIGWLLSRVLTNLEPMTAGQSVLADWALRGKNWVNLGTGGELMHGRRGNYPPRSPDYAPWVSIYIVEAAESRGMRRRAIPPPRIPGGLGAKSGLGACTFLGRDQYLTVCLCHELYR